MQKVVRQSCDGKKASRVQDFYIPSLHHSYIDPILSPRSIGGILPVEANTPVHVVPRLLPRNSTPYGSNLRLGDHDAVGISVDLADMYLNMLIVQGLDEFLACVVA